MKDIRKSKYEREIVEAIERGEVKSISSFDEEKMKLLSIVRKQFKDGKVGRQLPKESK